MALKQEFRLNKRILCLLLQEQRSALLIFSILSCRLQASARTVSSLWIIQLLHAQMSGTWAKSSYIVQFQAKKKKKTVWSRGRAINRPRAVQMQNSFRMACSKNSMVHSRASGVLQHMPPIQTPALLPVLNGTQQGLAASRAGSHDLE